MALLLPATEDEEATVITATTMTATMLTALAKAFSKRIPFSSNRRHLRLVPTAPSPRHSRPARAVSSASLQDPYTPYHTEPTGVQVNLYFLFQLRSCCPSSTCPALVSRYWSTPTHPTVIGFSSLFQQHRNFSFSPSAPKRKETAMMA